MSEGQMIATTNVLIELLHLCAAKLPNIFILLDGIDECSDSEDLLADLSQLDVLSTYKFLFLSRHNLPQLAKMIPNHQQKEMERVLVSNDIAIYLEHQLQQLVEEDMLPEHKDTSSLVAHMVKGADGMFLWATLMISYLKSPILTPSRRVRTIMEIVMPEGLESMYERIIGLIQRHRKPERDLASQVLVWLIYAKQRFSVCQLRSIVMENEEESSIMHFTQTVTFVCGSLVESRRVGADDCIDFIHLSAREYFNQSNGGLPSPNNFLDSLIPPKEIANLYLAKQCFTELIAGQGIRGRSLGCQFTSYAIKYATEHLMDTRGFLFTPSFKSNGEWQKNAMDMLKTCQEFLREPSAISSWIESIYRQGRLMSEGMNSPIPYDSIKQWAEWADLYMPAEKDRNLIADMKDFVTDMKAVYFHWDSNLRSDPSLIWDEVSAFTQSRFLQPSTSTNVSSLKPKQPENAFTSSRSLCTISSVSSDCNQTGILTIWPSTAFEESWQKLEPGEPLTSMLHLCSGWRATYELWIQDERKHSIQIDLEESEVSMLMRQSFREELTNEWKTSFPLVISPSLTSFIILRTLFTLNPSTYTKSKIDLSFLDSTYSYWNPDLQPFEPQIQDLPNLPPFLRHLHHDWYSYKFTFSPSEDYILFSDFVYHQESTNLSILRRSPLGKVEHISSLKIKMPFRHEHKLLSIFHPGEDLLFFFASGQVQAWRFMNSE